MKTHLSSLAARLVMFFAVTFLVFGWVFETSAQTAFSQEALADLIKPSVVRIADHVSGTAKVPEIKVDIKQHLVAVIPNTYNEVSVDEYLVGSGFIIHPDGYIATNSHVVSQETVKQKLASESALSALYANALFLSDAEMQDFLDTETENSFSKKVLDYVIAHSIFQLESNTVVFRPDSSKKTLPELLAEGLPATVVYKNDNFAEDEKDVALLKIDETHLPALSLGNGDSVAVGTKAFIFGFPATAELRQNSSGEATFTGGLVSAIKQSSGGGFKLFQTDAKVSEGSSGGPLFDERGEVIGLVTFQTDQMNRASGDNFAFALPIEIVKEAAEVANITPTEGRYGEYFKKGFLDFSGKHCDKANENFYAALSDGNQMFLLEKYVDSYFKRCKELQKSGSALDSRWDEMKGKIATLGSPLFYLLGAGLLIVGIFGAAIFWLLRQVRYEEREIEALETRLYADEARIKSFNSVPRPRVHNRTRRESVSQEKKKIV